MSASSIFKLLRPLHWLKNVLIFFPMIFAGRLFETALLLNTSIAFLSFCLLSSSVYIINDCFDYEFDRTHPSKCRRPLAAGLISKQRALIIAGGCLLVALVCAYLFLPTIVLGLSLLYLAVNLIYSSTLKHFAIIDVALVASGFVIRIFVGGAVGSILISHWLVLMTFLLALFLALSKRRSEMLEALRSDAPLRSSAKGYSLRFIDRVLTLFAAILIVCYIMYSISPEVTDRVGSAYVYLTALPVILGVLRHLQLTIIKHNLYEPVLVLFNDRFIALLVISWLLGFGLLLYL